MIKNDLQKAELSYPLSPMQQGMLFHSVYDAQPGVDIEQMVCRLPEKIDARKLEAAWNKVIERHAILRTGFQWEGLQEPLQVVRPAATIRIHEEDWRSKNAHENLSKYLFEDRVNGFSLSEPPLMRLALFRVEDDVYQFVWTFHHALLDGRSFPIVLNEVFAYYEGKKIDFAEPVPYQTFIEWLQKRDFRSSEAFWRESLRGFTAPLRLSFLKSGSEDFHGYRHQVIRIPATVTAQLKSLADQHSLTLNTFLQAAWSILLYRYGGQRDVIFGATRACRHSTVPGAEEIVGLFINTLPVRVEILPDRPVLSLLKELRQKHLATRAHEHTPLNKIKQWSDIPGGNSLFDTILVFENYFLDSALKSQGGKWKNRDFELHEQTNYPITLAVYADVEIVVKIEYDPRRVEDRTVTMILSHLKTLLTDIAANPVKEIRDVEILTGPERVQISDWSSQKKEFKKEKLLHQLFEAQVQRQPDSIAVKFEDQKLSYRELNERSNQLAQFLKASGVGADVLVGISMDRSIDLVVSILGILKAGGAYLPLDLAYPPERIAFMLEDAAVPILLTQQKLLSGLPKTKAKVISIDSDWTKLANESKENLRADISPDNLTYVIYTSGSTGKPKGVQISHYNVVRLFQATEHWYRFDSNDVWTLFHSYAFDFSVWELWGALLYGGRLVVVPYLTSRSPEDFYKLLRAERVTVLNQTPSAFRQLIQAEQSLSEREDLNLRLVIFGGEALDLKILKPWFERHGDQKPQLVNMYGITETTVHVSYRPLTNQDAQTASGSVIGGAIPDLSIHVLDENLKPAPAEVPGEMYVGGAGLARGYLNRPELTPERFIQNPFDTRKESRLYKTGDLARRLHNGDLEYLGRIDQQVKIRGFRIELAEIETVLRTHAAVKDLIVIVREDLAGDKRLVAYLIPNNGRTPTSAGLIQFAKSKLPEYMVPSAFILLNRFPLTPNGKLDIPALPKPELRSSAPAGNAAPRTQIEERLAKVWSDVLRVQPIGIHDNFFELGGDSILAIQIISRTRQAGLQLTAKDLFQQPTIAELARIVTESRTVVPSGPVTGSVALTPIQHWFFEQQLAAPHHYNQAFLFTLKQKVNLESLEKAFHKVLQHHDAFRLRFTKKESGWHQEYTESEQYLPQIKRFAKNQIETISNELQSALNFETGPVIQIAYFDNENEDKLLIVIHHLVVDGVSWMILMEDFESAYWQIREGKHPELPAKTTSFQRWAETLSEYAESQKAQKDLNYWTSKKFSGSSESPNRVEDARTITLRLHAAETDDLLHQVPATYNTQINDVLLAALAQAFSDETGNSALILNLEGHGREEISSGVDVSRTVGWFTSIFPVQLELKNSSDRGASLKQIKEQLRQIPDRGIGFGFLRYLSKHPDLASLPTPAIAFNYFGQLDQMVSKSKLFSRVEPSNAPWSAPENSRKHSIEINAYVLSNELRIDWTYGSKIFSSEKMESLAQNFIRQLKALIQHCLSLEAGAYTPSDFPDADLSESDLDEIITGLNGTE